MLLLPSRLQDTLSFQTRMSVLKRMRLKIVADPTRASFALVGNPILKKNGFIGFDKHALPVAIPLYYKGTKTD